MTTNFTFNFNLFILYHIHYLESLKQKLQFNRSIDTKSHLTNVVVFKWDVYIHTSHMAFLEGGTRDFCGGVYVA